VGWAEKSDGEISEHPQQQGEIPGVFYVFFTSDRAAAQIKEVSDDECVFLSPLIFVTIFVQ